MSFQANGSKGKVHDKRLGRKPNKCFCGSEMFDVGHNLWVKGGRLVRIKVCQDSQYHRAGAHYRIIYPRKVRSNGH